LTAIVEQLIAMMNEAANTLGLLSILK